MKEENRKPVLLPPVPYSPTAFIFRWVHLFGACRQRTFSRFSSFGGHTASKVDQHKVSLSDGKKILGRQSHRVSNGKQFPQSSSAKTHYGQHKNETTLGSVRPDGSLFWERGWLYRITVYDNVSWMKYIWFVWTKNIFLENGFTNAAKLNTVCRTFASQSNPDSAGSWGRLINENIPCITAMLFWQWKGLLEIHSFHANPNWKDSQVQYSLMVCTLAFCSCLARRTVHSWKAFTKIHLYRRETQGRGSENVTWHSYAE